VARAHRIQQRGNAVDRVRVDAAAPERFQHALAGHQRHLALGRAAAHHHRDAAECGGVG